MAIDWKGEHLGVVETRRHYTNYFKGIPHFKEYRMKMVTSDDANDVFTAFNEVEAILIYFSINSLVILLLAILAAIKPKTVIVQNTIRRFINLNSTGYAKSGTIMNSSNFF